MSLATDRVFRRYKSLFLPVVAGVVLVSTMAACAAAAAVGGGLGAALFLAYLLLIFDRGVLIGNGWLRRHLRDRLQRLGELCDEAGTRFVGLAHECLAADLRRRLVETDDDVGFLQVTWQGLRYRGDGFSFDLPADRIAGVSLTWSPLAPWRRVMVRTVDGEPFDTFILDSRGHGSHAACRADNHALYRELRQLVLLHQPPAERLREPLTSAEPEPLATGGR